MRKSFWIAFIVIFLSAVSIGVGVFLAEKNIKNSKEKLIDSSLTDDASIIKDNIKDGGISLSRPGPSSAPSESIPESEKAEEEITPAPVPETAVNKFSFGILGDTQRTSFESSSGFYKAMQILKEKNPEFLAVVGDLLSSCDGKSGCQSKMDRWKGVISSLFSKTYAVMGNHDRSGGDKADKLWQDFFSFPTNGPSGFSELTYSLDVKNAHLVFLNSEKPEEHKINSEQRDWLKKDLQDNSKDLTFVFFHEPAYPVSSKIDESLDANKKDRDALWKILSDEKVTAVFSGHEHIVSRKKIDGVYQFVFGNTDAFDHDLPKTGVAEYSYQGESFGWVEVVDKKVTIKTFSVDGKELNSFELPL
ncbi:metallophosphoesterase [Patescibacteria group bacterium]|nr:metallophosphoesterase [Patescibacteria group bacterium]